MVAYIAWAAFTSRGLRLIEYTTVEGTRAPLSTEFVIEANKHSRFLAISLTTEDAALLGAGQVSIAGEQCQGDSQGLTTASVLQSQLVALVQPVMCARYRIRFDTDSQALSRELFLHVEMQRGDWALTAFFLRSLMLVMLVLMFIWGFRKWVRFAWVRRSALCQRSSLILCLASILECDPAMLLEWSLHLPYRPIFHCSRALPGVLYPWVVLHMVGEILTDLHMDKESASRAMRYQNEVAGNHGQRITTFVTNFFCLDSCWSSGQPYFFLVITFVEVLIVVLASCGIVSTSLLLTEALPGIAVDEHYQSFMQTVHMTHYIVQLLANVLVVWSLFRFTRLYFHLQRFPYSHCRLHHIVFSFLAFVYMLEELQTFVLSRLWLVRWEGVRSMTWSYMNDLSFGMLLSGGADDQIGVQIKHAIYAIVFVAVFQQDEPPLVAEAATQAPHHARAPTQKPFKAELPFPMLRQLAHCACVTYENTDCEHEADVLTQVETMLHTTIGGFENDLQLAHLVCRKVLRHPGTDSYAIVATAKVLEGGSEHDVCVIAFRGTSSSQNAWTDLQAKIVPPKLKSLRILDKEGHEGIRVHMGFQDALHSILEDLLQAVRKLKCDHILCTGHSLGGALATLATVELARDEMLKKPTLCCTFGSPRVGNPAFVRAFTKSACNSVRVVCESDPIPVFPTVCGPWGCQCATYKHVPGLLHIYKNGWRMSKPTFLEDALRSWVPSLWILLFYRLNLCRNVPFHLMDTYIRALDAVGMLEGSSEGESLTEALLDDRRGILTSFEPHDDQLA